LKKIVYISPDVKAKGGISTVLKSYLNSNLNGKYHLKCISSHVDGSIARKFVQVIYGLIKLLFYLELSHVDIVHIHGSDVISSKRKYFYFKLAYLFNSKLIYHFHGASFSEQFSKTSIFWRKKIMEMFQEVDLVICLSNNWRDEIKKIAPHANIVVVPNSVKLPLLSNRVYNSENISILFLGLIGERKGLFDLIKVFMRLLTDGNNIVLNIGGNGDTTKLLTAIFDLGINKHANYLGWVSEEERDRLFRETDIFVLPSYAEGMPMSILEAMSYGVPVISTIVGGIPELIEDGETGLLVNPGDIDMLYEKMNDLIHNDEYRKKLGENGRLKIEKNHNISEHIYRIDNIYNTL